LIKQLVSQFTILRDGLRLDITQQAMKSIHSNLIRLKQREMLKAKRRAKDIKNHRGQTTWMAQRVME